MPLRVFAALAALVVLAGCSAGGAPASPATELATVDPGVALPDPGTGDVCLYGTWDADLPGLASQMEAEFNHAATLGFAFERMSADGALVWVFEPDHTFRWGGPVTFTAYAADDAGMEMTLELAMAGEVTGRWVYADPSDASITLSDVDKSLFSITPKVTVNGMLLDDPTAFDGVFDGAPTGGDVTISCSGSGLLTQPVGSPYVTEWTRF